MPSVHYTYTEDHPIWVYAEAHWKSNPRRRLLELATALAYGAALDEFLGDFNFIELVPTRYESCLVSNVDPEDFSIYYSITDDEGVPRPVSNYPFDHDDLEEIERAKLLTHEVPSPRQLQLDFVLRSISGASIWRQSWQKFCDRCSEYMSYDQEDEHRILEEINILYARV